MIANQRGHAMDSSTVPRANLNPSATVGIC